MGAENSEVLDQYYHGLSTEGFAFLRFGEDQWRVDLHEKVPEIRSIEVLHSSLLPCFKPQDVLASLLAFILHPANDPLTLIREVVEIHDPCFPAEKVWPGVLFQVCAHPLAPGTVFRWLPEDYLGELAYIRADEPLSLASTIATNPAFLAKYPERRNQFLSPEPIWPLDPHNFLTPETTLKWVGGVGSGDDEN